MAQLFNQHSYVFSVIFLLLIIIPLVWRNDGLSQPMRFVVIGIFILASVGLGFLLRFPERSVESAEEVDNLLGNGQPTYVMLLSQY